MKDMMHKVAQERAGKDDGGLQIMLAIRGASLPEYDDEDDGEEEEEEEDDKGGEAECPECGCECDSKFCPDFGERMPVAKPAKK